MGTPRVTAGAIALAATLAAMATVGPTAGVASASTAHATPATWHVQSSPNPPGTTRNADLYDIACPTASSCVAVGQSSDTSYKNANRLLERWNGSAWSIQTTPAPSGNPLTSFFSVACSSASACTVVGASYPASGDRSLVERWNGTQWSIQTTPVPSSGKALLFGVACPSATSCFAVGDSEASNGNPPLILHWNGSSWSLQTVAHPAGTHYIFYSVACRSTSDCTAVGEIAHAAGAASPLIVHWNGSKWSAQTPGAPAGGRSAFLSDVRCPSATQCLAVGDTYVPDGNAISDTFGLAEAWDGHTWTVLATPIPIQGANDQYMGVACPAVSKCVIVGLYASSTIVPLVFRWDGSTFAEDNEQSVGNFSYLDSVNCNGANSCVAVGEGRPSTVDRTLVERSP